MASDRPKLKRGLTSLDVMATVAELQCLVGGHIDKIYDWGKDRLIIRINAPGAKAEVRVQLGGWMYMSSEHASNVQDPGGFVMLLRKHLGNGYISAIRQHRFDRIVVFDIERSENYRLVFELFRSGNVALVKGGEIVQPLRPQSWEARTVRRGREYLFPPGGMDPRTMSLDELNDVIRDSKKRLVQCLATEAGMGGWLAEEAVALAGLDKASKAAELDAAQVRALFEGVQGIFRRVETERSPRLYLFEGKPFDVSPIAVGMYPGAESREFCTFGNAVEHYLASAPLDEKDARPDRVESERQRFERQRQQQAKAVTRFQESIERNQRTGEAIYANYQLCESVLKTASELRKSDSWSAVEERLASVKEVTHVNPSEGWIKLDLAIEGEHVDAKLDVRKDVNQNAQDYYQAASKDRARLQGARQAMEETGIEMERRLNELEEAQAIPEAGRRSSKRFWFERYRWFVSSDGKLVIGGRDTQTNDRVVKKHMKELDRYAHADLPGAPSIVIKADDSEIPSSTLEEACIFAVLFSKGWRQGYATASAYWVLPDQVSKRPNPGEYLAKGAFVIRGKRNYVHHIDFAAAVGEIDWDGERKLMCGPPSAVKARSRRYILFRPGEMEKNAFASEVARALDFSIEEALSVLPPGGVTVVERVGIKEE